jgi:two-component system phosphate regulon sensor histidine kinase PhoR
MNKKIYIAIALLGISMLGVISFQAYWLKENHKTELRNFKHDIYRSLSTAMNHELEIRIDKVVNTMGVNKYWYSNDNEPKHRRRRHQNANTQPNYFEVEKIITNGILGDSAFFEFRINDSIVESKAWKSRSGSNRQLDFRQKKMDRILLSVMSKMDNPHQVPGIKFNSDEFNKAFKEELNELGIDIDYKLALVVYKDEIIKEIKGKFKKSELDKATFFNIKHSSYPGARVAVLFPNKGMYIVSKNAMMSITSFILILFSIGSILYIIRSFFSQKRISEIRRDFMNNMTHELKTPISTVGLALEAMQDFKILENPERTEQYISIARKENHRLGMLVEKVLKMSAYERENIHMKWEFVKGDTTVDDVINNLTFQIENKGGIINKNMDASSAIIKVDKVHFTNVIYNLLDNALKYSIDKPEISINTYIENSFWYVEIKDNGMGIPNAYQNKIFEKFFRVPSGNVHNVKGYGLGLSYVFNIINKFEGDISVKSEVGDGSTFTIKLPINNG